jgi:hypothetical protein
MSMTCTLREQLLSGPSVWEWVHFVLCDDIFSLYKDEIRAVARGLTPAIMRKVEDGLRAALASVSYFELKNPRSGL